MNQQPVKPEKIAVITDSCADLPPEVLEQYGIYIIPMQIVFSEKTYQDGVDITPDQVYERLPQEIPKTSLPLGETILNTFLQVQEAGYTHGLVLIFSSGLSGSFSLVSTLAAEFPGITLKVFDTLSGSLGSGSVALRAAQLVAQGISWTKLLAVVPELIGNIHAFFAINTLEYLKKGGRIGLVSSVAGTMLQIKPILSFAPDGQLVDVAKVRGRNRSLEKLVELVKAVPLEGRRFLLLTAHGGAPEECNQVREALRQALPEPAGEFQGIIDCTLAVHVGPGLVGAGILILEDEF